MILMPKSMKWIILNPQNLLVINNPLLIISSTYGQGDVPDGSKNFYNDLKSSKMNLNISNMLFLV